jgi:hypothetical protein
MHKLIYIIFFLFPFIGLTQTDTIAHLYTFGGISSDNAEEIEATSDGGYIVVGSTSSNSSGNTDVYLLKVDSLCNYEWSFALGGANNDWGYSVKQTHDNGYIIAASSNSYGNGGYDAVLMKRDSLGGFVWQKKYGGQDWDFAYSVVQTFDSGYVFCGETYNNTSGYSDVYVVKTNPLGDTLWTQTIGGTLIDKGNCVIETSDSNIVIAGLTNTIADSTQAYVIKLNNNGILLWDSIYGGVGYEYANQIIELDNGNYVFSGATNSLSVFGDKDYLITCIGSSGSFIWDFTITNGNSPNDNEDASSLIQRQNGNIVITGYSQTGGNMTNVVFFELTSVGGWANASSVLGNSDNDVIKNVVIGNNGDVVGAGSTFSLGAGMDDVLLVRLDTIYGGQDVSNFSFMDNTPISVNEVNFSEKINVFPNPIKQIFTIQVDLKLQIESIFIYDISGRNVSFRRIEEELIDISQLTNGIYFLEVNFDSKASYKTKIVKY